MGPTQSTEKALSRKTNGRISPLIKDSKLGDIQRSCPPDAKVINPEFHAQQLSDGGSWFRPWLLPVVLPTQ